MTGIYNKPTLLSRCSLPFGTTMRIPSSCQQAQLLGGSRTLHTVRDRAGYIFQTVGTPQNVWEPFGNQRACVRGTGCHIPYTFPDDMCPDTSEIVSGRSGSQRISTLNLNTGNFLRPNGDRIPTKTSTRCQRQRMKSMAIGALRRRKSGDCLTELFSNPLTAVILSSPHGLASEESPHASRTIQRPTPPTPAPKHHQPPTRRLFSHQVRFLLRQHAQPHNR